MLLAVTDAATADAFLRPHLVASVGRWPTALAAGDSELLRRVAQETGARAVPLPLVRNPSPIRDLRALLVSCRAVGRLRPRAVHLGTPKAGLVVGLAAALCRVPVRLYSLHGLRYETAVGWRRRLLIALERQACRSATVIVAVSASVAERAERDGVVPRHRVRVLGSGSITGVASERFAHSAENGRAFRAQHGLPEPAQVVLFVGRLSADKGLDDLARSWPAVVAACPDAHLLLVGGQDPAQPVSVETITALRKDLSVTSVGHAEDTVPAYSAADLLVLPSLREGFPTVVLEAAAAGLPAVVSDVTGCRDAVVDGVTGVLVPPRDPVALAEALAGLLRDRVRREDLGAAARERVVMQFKPADVVARYLSVLAP